MKSLPSIVPSQWIRVGPIEHKEPSDGQAREGIRVAHANELVLRVVPCRDKLGNVGEGLVLGDQELIRLSVEEEVREQFQIFESTSSDSSLPVIVVKRTLLAIGCERAVC